jgi:hypothetical protein
MLVVAESNSFLAYFAAFSYILLRQEPNLRSLTSLKRGNIYVLHGQILCAVVMCMSNITIRLPEDLKERMERCKNINWSEVARKAFEEAARRQEILCAASAIDKLRIESKVRWNGAKEIRKWRDAER